MMTFEDIIGVKSDTFHLTSSVRNSNIRPAKVLHVFFFAGNPGTLHFYTTFLDKLFNGIVDSPYFVRYDVIKLHGVGHANHHLEGRACKSSTAAEDAESFNLEFQILHKLSFISSVLDCSSDASSAEQLDCEIMLIGHSIGAYMVIDALQRCEQLTFRTKHIVLLMPFISWSRLPYLHRAKLSTYSTLHPISNRLLTSIASPVLKLEPCTKRKLVSRVTTLKGEPLKTVADGLMNMRLLRNFLAMGIDEIRDVKTNQSRMSLLLETLDACGTANIFILYTDNDEWAPEADAEHFRQKLKSNTTILIEPGLTHAFSLTDLRMEKTCFHILEYFSKKSKTGEKKLMSRL
jgi:pimeloyl-ACP methyl ester carboxylesterase